MCGSCARLVVAPRPRVPVPVQGSRPPVAVPGARPTPQPDPQPVAVPVASQTQTAPVPATPAADAGANNVSPWVRNRTGDGDASNAGETTVSIELGASHDGGLLKRGVHAEVEHAD